MAIFIGTERNSDNYVYDADFYLKMLKMGSAEEKCHLSVCACLSPQTHPLSLEAKELKFFI